jgi:hypothetical protein
VFITSGITSYLHPNPNLSWSQRKKKKKNMKIHLINSVNRIPSCYLMSSDLTIQLYINQWNQKTRSLGGDKRKNTHTKTSLPFHPQKAYTKSWNDNIVAYRPLANQWLCKHWLLLGNVRNSHARNNTRTAFSMWFTS